MSGSKDNELASFAFNAVHQLDKARTILTNAKTLHSTEEMTRAIGYAVQEIEPVFLAAKKTCAVVQGTDDADVASRV